jgi:hypothetical protein
MRAPKLRILAAKGPMSQEWPPNNEMQLTRSAPSREPRPSQLISVFDGP